jgi:hypothetical protein
MLADPHDMATVRVGALVHYPKPAMALVEIDGTLDVRGP